MALTSLDARIDQVLEATVSQDSTPRMPQTRQAPDLLGTPVCEHLYDIHDDSLLVLSMSRGNPDGSWYEAIVVDQPPELLPEGVRLASQATSFTVYDHERARITRDLRNGMGYQKVSLLSDYRRII